ncbi:CDP-glucose 4,6-dehydratase [Pirellulaceae bacterium SH449]
MLYLSDTYSGARVLITGHTGFKGAWLTKWLASLGAQVTGYSLAPEGDRSLYNALGLDSQINSVIADIRDYRSLASTLNQVQPDFVFHLAAQSLVRRSYKSPADTFATNVTGTINLLEAMRELGDLDKRCSVVIVTSDKCYRNVERTYAYVETDPLGGHDPYSSSKAMAELAAESYRSSFFPPDRSSVLIASARAGNVIGGGDWAEDRIVPDCVRSLDAGLPITLRNPHAYRPWQHVLEPLYGYLLLAAKMCQAIEPNDLRAMCSAFNFGPVCSNNKSVDQLVDEVLLHWPGRKEYKQPSQAPHEANLLQLSAAKAEMTLGWKPNWGFETTVQKTIDWYKAFRSGQSAIALTEQQIQDYESILACPPNQSSPS